MTKRMRSRVQAAEIGFLPKVRGLFLLFKIKNTDICQSLNIEPLLLRIEQSQLRWYGHVTQMFHKETAKQLMDALPSGKRLEGDPDSLEEYVEDLAWSRHAILPAKLPLVAGDRDAWRSQLELLLPQPQKDKQAKGNTLNNLTVFLKMMMMMIKYKNYL